MLDALAITEAEAAGLTELAALDLAMAKDFAARAQAAEDPATANDLARSYQRAARSYRQTLALKMRLARELARAEREDRLNPQPIDPRAARRRMNEVRSAVERVVFAETEAEPDEDLDVTLELLEALVADYAAQPDFPRRRLDDLVAEACEELGLPADLAARWRDLPDPDALPPDIAAMAAAPPDLEPRDTG